MTYKYQVTILETHLDLFGHVNNATYLQLFEEARWDFIVKNGYGVEQVKKFKKGPVILRVDLKFTKEIKSREVITIESSMVGKLNRTVSKIQQQMINEAGDVCAIAVFDFGLMDLVERKLIAPTPEWIKAVGGDI